MFELVEIDHAVAVLVNLGKERFHVGHGDIFVTRVAQQRRKLVTVNRASAVHVILVERLAERCRTRGVGVIWRRGRRPGRPEEREREGRRRVARVTVALAPVDRGGRRRGRRHEDRGAAAPRQHPLQVRRAPAALVVFRLARVECCDHSFELVEFDLAVAIRVNLGKELLHVCCGEVFETAVVQ